VRVTVAPAAPAATLPPGPAPRITEHDRVRRRVVAARLHPSRLLVSWIASRSRVDRRRDGGPVAPSKLTAVRHDRTATLTAGCRSITVCEHDQRQGTRRTRGESRLRIVCHYPSTYPDAQSAARIHGPHNDSPVGTHVAINGTFVQEKNHKKWNEIHPVSRIQVQ